MSGRDTILNRPEGLPELLVEVLDVKDVESLGPVYVSLQVGQTRLRANIKGRDDIAEAFRFTYRSLHELYRETLVYTIVAQKTEQNVARGSIPISRLKIGKKVDRYFDTSPLLPELNKAPTVRLALELTGPLRPEFEMLQNLVNRYYRSVDGGIAFAASAGSRVLNPYVLVPLAGVFLAMLPIVALAVTIGLPLFFPIILLAFVAVITVGAGVVVMALSSRSSRARIQALINPFVSKLTTTAVGQEILYQTGPRPSPIRVLKTFAPNDMWGKLAASLIIDAIGASSYAVPGLGELADLAWAPTQAVLMAAMYSETVPYAPYFGLIEELLPFTDIIPSATLAWLKENSTQFLNSPQLNTVADAVRRHAPRNQ